MVSKQRISLNTGLSLVRGASHLKEAEEVESMVSKKMNWKSWVMLGAAVALFVTSGGLLMASNMGFKINKPLTNGHTTGTLRGFNWTSIPFNNPYNNYRGLCKAFVDQWGTVVAAQVVIGELLNNGSPVTQNCFGCCPTPACTGTGVNCNALIKNPDNPQSTPGVQLQINGTTLASPTNIVLVGSSVEPQNLPTLVCPILTGSNKNNNWISVPYHTTWTAANDVCVSLGTTTLASAVRISRIDGAGNTFTFNCGTTLPSPSNFNLVIGEALRITKSSPTTGCVFPTPSVAPPHF